MWASDMATSRRLPSPESTTPFEAIRFEAEVDYLRAKRSLDEANDGLRFAPVLTRQRMCLTNAGRLGSLPAAASGAAASGARLERRWPRRSSTSRASACSTSPTESCGTTRLSWPDWVCCSSPHERTLQGSTRCIQHSDSPPRLCQFKQVVRVPSRSACPHFTGHNDERPSSNAGTKRLATLNAMRSMCRLPPRFFRNAEERARMPFAACAGERCSCTIRSTPRM